MSVKFYSEETNFNLENQQSFRKWIDSVILDKGLVPGTLNYIFCNDEYLLKINQQYLQHDTYTDIITFDYSSGKVVSGDIFISIERVTENALKFKIPFDNELSRVIVHGILHLCGLSDKSEVESQNMRSEEDKYILRLSE